MPQSALIGKHEPNNSRSRKPLTELIKVFDPQSQEVPKWMASLNYLPSWYRKQGSTILAFITQFVDASYSKRYELFCRRLVLERHYDSATFLMSAANSGLNGDYSEPANDLTFQRFANTLVAHVAAHTGQIAKI